MRVWLAIGLAVLAAVCLATPLRAESKDDQDDLRATVEALKQCLKDQDTRLGELESQEAQSKQQQQETYAQMLKDLQKEIATRSAMPAWMDNLKFYGDLRLRYEDDLYNWGATKNSEKPNRQRARFRLRFGLVKTWLDDQLEVGFRLASGDSNDPTSTNQTFTDNYSKKYVWIDLAYARYAPKAVPGLSFTGGKMKNPWLMNDIFMDTDVNPEGFWGEYKSPAIGAFEPFAGAGYFILAERAGTSAPTHDTIMYGYQAGTAVNFSKDLKYTIASYYQNYDYYDDSGALPRGNDKPLSNVPQFNVVGLTNNVDFKVLSLPVNVFADWAHNCGATDTQDEYEGQRNAYAFGAELGQNKKKGDWSIKYEYAIVQANSLPGNFVDADFGFANRRGHVVRGEYNITNDLTFGASFYATEPIFSPTTTSGSSAFEDKAYTVQADLIWKF